MLAGADPHQVRDAYRARQAHKIPPNWDGPIMRAVDWLEMSERALEMRIYADTKQANAIFPLRDGRQGPRFAYYHTHRSVHSPPGFLDDVLVDRQLGIYHTWENKREDGRVRPEQEFWITMLREHGEPSCGGMHVVCHSIVRPSDWYTSVRHAVLGV